MFYYLKYNGPCSQDLSLHTGVDERTWNQQDMAVAEYRK